MVKSTCPGVSMMLTRCSSYCLDMPDQKQVVAAEVMVIPRSCSSAGLFSRVIARHTSLLHRCSVVNLVKATLCVLSCFGVLYIYLTDSFGKGFCCHLATSM